jgi:general secretion pathway protein N
MTKMQGKNALAPKLNAGRYSPQGPNQMRDNKASKLSYKQKFALLCLTLFCVLFTVFVFAPAAWLSVYLQSETDGRFVLSDAEGSLWNGSAFIGIAVDNHSVLSSLLPGRFSWHVSPILLLGQIELILENPDALQQPLYLTGNFHEVQVNPNDLILPAERLAGLGAPLNTVKPSGQMMLSWGVLSATFLDGNVDINGTMKLTLSDISSALSPIKPLGSYLMSFDWRGHSAEMDLQTIHGPMLLSGKGSLTHGKLKFSGLAQAQKEQEENLANLLNLLGQARPGANKNVISLEFK